MNSPDYHAMTATEVADHVSRQRATAQREADRRKQRYRIRHGIEKVLTAIENHPDAAAGSTWQERWYLADGDHQILAHAATHNPHHVGGRADTYMWNVGLSALIAEHIIRPGIVATTPRIVASVVCRPVQAEHEQDFDAVLDEVGSVRQLTSTKAIEIRGALAAMILFTGRPLSQITPSEWAAAERQRQEVMKRYSARSKIAQRNVHTLPEGHHLLGTITLHNAYSGCVRTGLIAPDGNPEIGKAPVPATLRNALAEPWSVDWCIRSRGQRLGPNVAAMLCDVLIVKNGAYDHSTLNSKVARLAVLMEAVRKVDPTLDTLDIPMHIADQALAHLKTADANKRKPGTKRLDVAGVLSCTRSTWRMCEKTVRRYGLKQHEHLLGPFPFDDDTVREIKRNERRNRETRHHERVRRQIPHLDPLVAATARWSADADELAQKAHAAAPSATFTHNGVQYQRAGTAKKRPLRTGTGHSIVSVREVGAKRYYSVDEYAMRAAREHLLVTILRETAIRVEELAELTLGDLQAMPNGDQQVPVIAVNPSKLDKGRTIPCTPILLATLHAYVGRITSYYGTYPKSTRFDHHESEEQTQAHLLLFQYAQRQFTGVATYNVRGWLRAISERYDAEINVGATRLGIMRPHGMRRAVASDLSDRGADLKAIQMLLGHANLASTDVYIKTDDQQAIYNIIAARRRDRPEAP